MINNIILYSIGQIMVKYAHHNIESELNNIGKCHICSGLSAQSVFIQQIAEHMKTIFNQ